MVYTVLAAAESIVSRFKCVACTSRSGVGALCSSCNKAVRPAEGCERCGSIKCYRVRESQEKGHSCAKVWYPFRTCTAALEYSPPVTDVIAALKRAGSYRCALFCAERLCNALPYEAGTVSLVTWVPAASAVKKGFDHGAILARAVATTLGVPSKRMLDRARSDEQKLMDRPRRIASARSSFVVRQAASSRSVLVVDDVTTTGASLYFAALELKKAGFGFVFAAAVARTPLGRVRPVA